MGFVERLSYRQWNELVAAVSGGRVRRLDSSAPTPAIYKALGGGDDRTALAPPFILFGRHTKKVLFEQIASGNVEYVMYYFDKLAKSHPIRHYTGYPSSSAMRKLLTRKKVRYDGPEAERR